MPLAVLDDHNRRWWVLAAMGGVLGLVVLDETVMGVALPTVREDLGMSAVTSHWVINAYLLVFTCFLAAAGKLGDVLGLRNVFIAGVAVFGAASFAAGFAQDGVWLIAARGVQGLGAAAIFPTSVAMISSVFSPEQRGIAFGIHTAIGGVFMSLGPLVGGFFTEMLSWRWIFWINPPLVGGIVLALLATGVNPPRKARTPGFDFVGLFTLVLGLSAIVLALMQGSQWGWSAPATLGLLAGGAISLVVFTLVELRLGDPLLDIALLRNPTITGCNLVVATGQFTKIAVIVFGALYLQEVLGMSPLQAGLALLAAVVPTGVSAIVAGRLADRTSPRRLLMAGLLLTGLALLWMAFAAVSKSYALLVPSLVIWGIALPYHYVPSRRAVSNAVAREKQAEAGGVNLSAQLLGGTIGMAVSGTLLVATNDYRIVFLVNAAMSFAVMIASWFLVERR